MALLRQMILHDLWKLTVMHEKSGFQGLDNVTVIIVCFCFVQRNFSSRSSWVSMQDLPSCTC